MNTGQRKRRSRSGEGTDQEQSGGRHGPSVRALAPQGPKHSAVDVLNFTPEALDAWLRNDPILLPRAGHESEPIGAEQERLLALFGLLKRVVAQSSDGGVSVKDIRKVNSHVQNVFGGQLQSAPVLWATAPGLGPSGSPEPWTVRRMEWLVRGNDGRFIFSEVATVLVDVLEMIAGQGRALLKCCPAPLHPTAEHGLGTCNTFFVDLHTGRPRSTCSDVCRRRLSDWRRRHAKPEEAFPPRSFPK